MMLRLWVHRALGILMTIVLFGILYFVLSRTPSHYCGFGCNNNISMSNASSLNTSSSMEPSIIVDSPRLDDKIVPSVTTKLSTTNKTVVVQKAPSSLCLHGTWITDRNGQRWCTRRFGGQEFRNYTLWLENQTTNTSSWFVYYQENCTNVTQGYVWQGIDAIVNSSHELSCQQIMAWNTNDGWRFR